MNMGTLTALALALTVTTAVEAIPALLFQPRWERLMASVVCNAATNPLLNLILLGLRHPGVPSPVYGAAVALLELSAVFAEAGLYRVFLEESRRKCFLYSLGVNALSYFTGLLLF